MLTDKLGKARRRHAGKTPVAVLGDPCGLENTGSKPIGQNVAVGTYTDSILVLVTF